MGIVGVIEPVLAITSFVLVNRDVGVKSIVTAKNIVSEMLVIGIKLR